MGDVLKPGKEQKEVDEKIIVQDEEVQYCNRQNTWKIVREIM